MKKIALTIFFLLLFIGLLLPSDIALSQETDEHDYASLIMTLELEDALRGKNEVAISRAYRDVYQTHYDRLISSYENQQRHTAAEKSKRQRDAVMQYLNDRVKKAEDNEDYFNNVMFVIQAVLIDGADSANQNPSTEPNSVIAHFLAIHEKQTKQNAADMLYGHTASGIPESSSVISSSSPSQTYHVDAGLPPSSAPPSVSQDDAGSSGNPDDSNNPLLLKPLRFTNTGLYDATVLVASYTPAAGVNASMSRASTVVFRESNPSAYLDLPLGTYVFCYYWDLGTDVDKDGYVDYAHRNTGKVILSGAPTDNTGSGQVVTLDPGNMNNPNGKCGETASPPPPSGNMVSLTPQELANQGTHTYAMNCVCNGASEQECDFWGGDWDPFGATIDFVEGGVNLTDEEGATYFQARLGANTYDYGDNMVNGVLTFTDVGMIYSGEGLICTALRR